MFFYRYDICKDVAVTELLRYDGSSQMVRVCSCLGDRCNASRSHADSPPFSITLYFAVVFLLHKLLL